MLQQTTAIPFHTLNIHHTESFCDSTLYLQYDILPFCLHVSY